LGNVNNYVKGKPQILEVWPIFTNTRLTQMEVASLEAVPFVEDCGGNLNPDDIPIPKLDNKIVHRVPFGKDHDNNWLFG
jgi:hypothetical protein